MNDPVYSEHVGHSVIGNRSLVVGVNMYKQLEADLAVRQPQHLQNLARLCICRKCLRPGGTMIKSKVGNGYEHVKCPSPGTQQPPVAMNRRLLRRHSRK